MLRNQVDKHNMSRPMAAFRKLSDCSFGRSVGLICLVGALIRYRSQNPGLFSRWSMPFLIIITGAGFAMLLAIGKSCRQFIAPNALDKISPANLCFEVAVLSWGLGYLVNSIDNPINGGQIADLNFVGSSLPFSMVAYWIALVASVLGFAGLFIGNKQIASVKFREIAFAIWCVALVLVLSEGFLRFRFAIAPETQGFPTYATDLWKRKYIKLNSVGFRDAEHELRPVQKDVHRLVVVGDSYAFGWGIRDVSDRFGEQLATKLILRDGEKWESINASRGDTHTLDHIDFLRAILSLQPKIVILLYVFNDIDYLHPVTSRTGQSEAPLSLVERIHPVRILFRNSFLFQEIYVRARLHLYSQMVNSESSHDPYEEIDTMNIHMNDISRFVSMAKQAGATVAVVPFEIGILENEGVRQRYANFVRRCINHDIPVLPITAGVYTGYNFRQLTVNALDRHPNELANRLAAQAVSNQLASVHTTRTSIY